VGQPLQGLLLWYLHLNFTKTFCVKKLHCVSKNVPPLACYNFDAREWILTFLAEMLLIK